MILNKQDRKIISEQNDDEIYGFVGETLYLRVYKADLPSLRAPVQISGIVEVNFGGMIVTTTTRDVLTVVTITPSPTSRATPMPTLEPTIEPVTTPIPTLESVAVHRKW